MNEVATEQRKLIKTQKEIIAELRQKIEKMEKGFFKLLPN